MTDPEQIPHLIKLLDDESSDVRTTVAHELASFGPTLKNQIKKVGIPINADQKARLGKILETHRRARLKRVWSSWTTLPAEQGSFVSDYKRLEGALSIIAEYLSGMDYDYTLKDCLDELASAYRIKYKENDPGMLAKFLFEEKGLSGDEENYYNPQNSNLVYVIKAKKGIPISLSTVYMLVGLRLGLRIEGCHFPGHFLGRINWEGRKVFIDCFNDGHVIEEKDLLSIKDDTFKAMSMVLREETNVGMIVRTFLANLVRCYQMKEDVENCDLIVNLFNEFDELENKIKASDLTPENIINFAKPHFEPGHCVKHKRYGYRGIIVDMDEDCTATDSWYYANQTQPSRSQPWYHILVSGSDQVTYVAENNMIRDDSKAKVTHPLLSYFFTKTKKGSYIRNENIWPGTDF